MLDLSRHPRARGLVAALLSLSLAVGGVPQLAWAEVASDLQADSDAPAAAAPQDVQPSAHEQAQEPAATPATPADASSDPAPQEADSSRAAADDEPEQSAASEQAEGDQGEATEELADEAATPSETDVTPAEEPAAAQLRLVAQKALSAAELADDSYLMIQSSKDVDGYGNRVSGELESGVTLWANLHDYDSDDAIAAGADWAYQWYAATSKASSLGAYTPLEGATSQSLTITEELAKSLAGSYLVVTMTAGGTTYVGPGFRGISASYVPGPISVPGVVSLYGVTLDVTEPCVGDTISATALRAYATPVAQDADVSWQWTADGEVIAAATGPVLVVGEELQGKRLTVTASTSAGTKLATTAAVAARGSVKLYSVELDTPAALQVGTTLTAHAFRGSYSSKTEVSDGVTYTWLASSSKYSGYEPLEGATSATLVVPDSCANKYVRVQATAGVNTVEVSTYGALGPFKLAGAYDLSTVSVFAEGQTSGNNAYTTDDTLWALAKESGASSYVPADALSYQWMVSERGGSSQSAYEPIAGATAQTLSLAPYAGKYVGCVVTSKVGGSSRFGRVTKAIALPGSVNVTSVSLSKSGEVNPGDTLVATAKAADGSDVTQSDQLQWWWGVGDSSYGSFEPIAGATGTTLTLTDAQLGRYVKAFADGGYGDIGSTPAGPVVPKGAVSLYKVELTGEAVVGKTLTATAYKTSYTKVSAGDTVSYQWQYALSKSTADTDFFDIAGAPNEPTFTIPQTAVDGTSLVGTYIRVRCVSKDRVVSTSQKSYYGSTAKDPLGPVRVAGGYDLSSVKLASSGQGAQVGCVLTPTAQYRTTGSYSYETDVPSDAQLSYVWHVGDADGGDELVSPSLADSQGRLLLDESLVGRQLWCVATALMTPAVSAKVTVRPADDFDLLRVQFSRPATSQTLVVGDEVAVDVYARQLGVSYAGTTGTADKVSDRVGCGVDLVWQVADELDPDAAWSDLAGAATASLTLPPEAAGKYLRAVATSGQDPTNRVQVAYPHKVVDASSLEGIVARLEAANWRPEPTFGVDDNVNDLLRQKLVDMGVDVGGLTIKTVSAAFSSTRDEVSVDVSCADEDNGTITYLWADLDALSYFYPTSYQQVSLGFELSRGDERASFAPARKTTIGWDEDKARAYLEERSALVEIGYAAGDAADTVTADVSLPQTTVGSSKAKVTGWQSDSTALVVAGSSWASALTGTVTRGSADAAVSLEATIGFAGSGMPEVTTTRSFGLTVKADPERVAAETAALKELLENGFAYDKVTDARTGAAVDPAAVTCDLQLPTTRKLGVDGSRYLVCYTTDEPAITPNGFRGAVVRPLPGSPAAEVQLTCTITDKANPEICAQKSLSFVVTPAQDGDLDAELALLDEAVARYAQGICDGQDPTSVTGSLHAFQKCVRDGEGNIVWTYDKAASDAHPGGIVPVELAGYDPMGADGWRLFRSSRPDVIAHENLVLSVPTYNQQVSIDSLLASETYGSYYERYRNDPAVDAVTLAKLARLAGTPAAATVTVQGTTGLDDPDAGKPLSVTVRIVGPDASGALADWTDTLSLEMVQGDTAADATRVAAARSALTLSFAGPVLEAVISPLTGAKVANDRSGAYWQLWVNGRYSDCYASSAYLAAGDAIVWQYAADQVAPPAQEVGPTPSTDTADWTETAQGGNLTKAATPTVAGKDAWGPDAGYARGINGAATSLAVSEPLIVGGKVIVASGRSVMALSCETGAVEVMRENVLPAPIDATCRPLYADGLVFVPLSGGRLVALKAEDALAPDYLSCLWETPQLAEGEQATVPVRRMQVGTRALVTLGSAALAGDQATAGHIAVADARTGELLWTHANAHAGYYWAGAVQVGPYLLTGDTAGVVHVLGLLSGEEVGSCKVSDAAINADLVVYGESVLVTTRDGVLHRLNLSADGSLLAKDQLKLGVGATAAPTVVGDTAICAVCGTAAAQGQSALVVVDLTSLQLLHRVTQADGKPLAAGGVQAPVLVSQQGSDTYCYLTTNGKDGAAYLYRLGDAEAQLFFVPAGSKAGFCDSPLICDAAGNLYYLNDSGYVVRLAASDQRPVLPTDSVTPATDGSDTAKPAPTHSQHLSPIALRTRILLASGAQAVVTTPAAGLLDGLASTDIVGLPSQDAPAGDADALLQEGSDALVVSADGLAAAAVRLPRWPVVGVALGMVGLVTALLWRRRDEEVA